MVNELKGKRKLSKFLSIDNVQENLAESSVHEHFFQF
jgi:hypothetical protein